MHPIKVKERPYCPVAPGSTTTISTKSTQCREDFFLESQLRQRFLWLAVDGNHVNFARLFGGELPLVEIFGGGAYKIREHVYYLKRGDVFDIEGQTFFALGGAMSHYKDPFPATGLYYMQHTNIPNILTYIRLTIRPSILMLFKYVLLQSGGRRRE